MAEPWKSDKSHLDETDKKVLADVERYGWHCLHVHGAEGPPFWSFSIGVFRTWRHPELVVFGLPDTVAHEIVSDLVRRVESGESLAAEREYDDVLTDRSCRFFNVDPKWYPAFLGYVQWFYKTKDGFPFLQLVWPDEQLRYSWETGYIPTGGNQPLLISDAEAASLGL